MIHVPPFHTPRKSRLAVVAFRELVAPAVAAVATMPNARTTARLVNRMLIFFTTGLLLWAWSSVQLAFSDLGPLIE
jgi:hypothetical protein